MTPHKHIKVRVNRPKMPYPLADADEGMTTREHKCLKIYKKHLTTAIFYDII